MPFPAAPAMPDMTAGEAEIKRRLKRAEREKQMFEVDFREAYSFMMPHRIRPGYSQGSTRPQDANDNFTTIGEEVTTDFASDMADTFTPEHSKWASIEVAQAVPEEIRDDVEEAARQETGIIFDAIGASNFHEATKQGNKDLAVSAYGLAIEDAGPAEPFHCQVIPITELFILRGARGGIGTRYWKRRMIAEEIIATFPHLPLPASVTSAARKQGYGAKQFDVVQGCHQDFSVPAETAWMVFTMIDGKLLEMVRARG